MKNKNVIVIFFFISFLNFYSYSKANSPGTPSSSYNSNYYHKNLDKKKIVLEQSFSSPYIEIVVQGNNRLEPAVIIRDAEVDLITNNDEKSLSLALKNLYKTGYYEDVKIYKKNNIIYFNVKENPIIDQVSIEGNSEINDELILQEIDSKSRNVFSSDKVKSDVKKIQTLYKRQGFFSTFVEPKFIKLTENRVNLVFEVLEGREATIRKINFINNKVFSDSTLRDVISSSEYRWYEFWGSGDKFDQDRINYDKDLLKKYYFDNGYIDFEIVSVNSSLVNNRKDFVINLTIFEGKRYRVSDVKFKSAIRNIKKIDLDDLISFSAGDWFSSDDVDKSAQNITEKASEYGFAFVDVIPRIKKDKKGTVSVLFDVIEGNKIYINRINITGNLKTKDEILRKELELVEGDAFNLVKLRQSEKNLTSLALFDNVSLNFEGSNDTNKSNIDVEVSERSTGEFSVGAGFSSLDGALGNIGIKESNLFGEAKELSLDLGISTRKSSIDLSYTDPYIFNRDLAGGIDIYDIRKNNKTYSGYKHNLLGFKLRSGYEIIDDLRHFSSYALRRDKIHDIDNSTSIYIKDQEGKRVTSVIGQALQYDKLNDRMNPTDGYRLRLDVDYFGLGGDSEHLLAEFKVANFWRITDGLTLANFVEGGHIMSIKDIKINDRFFFSGDRLRGFKNHGVGPRDTDTSDALGGETYYLIRNELDFPMGLPDELGVSGILFADVGTLYDTSSSAPSVNDVDSLRISAGLGINWISPFGPVKIYLSTAIKKEKNDKTEIFRFSFGTTY